MALRFSSWRKVVLGAGLVACLVAGGGFLVGYVQKERAFAEVWLGGIHRERGVRAGEYLAACTLTPEEIDRLISTFPKCYTVDASERVAQLLNRSAPASWNTSPQAVKVCGELVTLVDNLQRSLNTLDSWTAEQNGISRTRVAAALTGLGFVGRGSSKALSRLKKRAMDKNAEVSAAAIKALQRLGMAEAPVTPE